MSYIAKVAWGLKQNLLLNSLKTELCSSWEQGKHCNKSEQFIQIYFSAAHIFSRNAEN